MKLFKFCWIRDKLNSYDGIDLLWFNFVKSSKRYISPEKAVQIKTHFSVLRVGVFGIQNENKTRRHLTKNDLKNIVETAKQANMQAVQIHGETDFYYLKLFGFVVIKSMSLENIKLDENVDFYIIDGKNPWSWKWYDYTKINDLKLNKKFLVAGGVSADNIGEIFDIFKNNPYFMWVDIASWVDNGENIDENKIKYIIYN